MLDGAAGGASRSRGVVDRAGLPRRPDLAALAWAGVLTVAVLLPIWLRPGFVLSYDLVAVPQQRLQPWMWGGAEAPPRSVPQDVLVAAFDDLVPGALLQRLLLTAVLLGAGAGMAWLAAPHGRVGQVVAVSAYAWSAYLYERLVIGHWGLLLAYAALPWLVALVTAARRGQARAAPLTVLVVAVGTWVPTGGALLVAVAVPMLLWPGAATSVRSRWLTVAGVLAVQLTWVVPAVLTAGSAQPGPDVFGLDADGLVGAVVAALGGGGIWNPRAAASSREGLGGVVAAVLVIAVLIAGLPGVRRALGSRTFAPLLLVALLLAGWAVATAIPALDAATGAVLRLPGGGLSRDAQKWLAPWWLVCSLAFGATAARAQRAIRPGNGALPYALALVPLLLLPQLVWGGWGRLTPARYPDAWEVTRIALAQASDDDLVVALPWSTFRRYPWNHDRTVLDPAPRYLPRTVVTDTTLLVTGPDGQPIAVPGDDPLSARVESALRASDPLDALREVGVGWVLVERGQPAAPAAPDVPDLSAAVPVVRTEELLLYRIPGPVAHLDRPAMLPVLAAWGALVVVVGVAAILLLRDIRRHGRRETDARN